MWYHIPQSCPEAEMGSPWTGGQFGLYSEILSKTNKPSCHHTIGVFWWYLNSRNRNLLRLKIFFILKHLHVYWHMEVLSWGGGWLEFWLDLQAWAITGNLKTKVLTTFLPFLSSFSFPSPWGFHLESLTAPALVTLPIITMTASLVW